MKNRTDLILYIVSLALFLAMAVLGWTQLPYGIFMLDEGMHMVDGWRLTVGDSLFPDSAISAIHLYGVFNAIIFWIFPDISLLGIRELAFGINFITLFLIGAAIYRWFPRFWPAPFLLSYYVLFGRNELSYHSYPRLFLILHLAFLLLALASQRQWLRNALFLCSGLALWCIGFSFLPLTPILISPLLIWVALKYFKPASVKLTRLELLLLISPGVLLWILLLLTYQQEFFNALFDVYRYVKDGGAVEKYRGSTWPYFMLASFIAAGLGAAWRLPMKFFSIAVLIAAVVIYFVIESNVLSGAQPFKYSQRSGNYAFSAGMILGIIVAIILLRQGNKAPVSTRTGIAMIFLIPSIFFSIVLSMTSTVGFVSILGAAVPIVMALALYFSERFSLRTNGITASVLPIVLFAPFYIQMGWASWERPVRFDAPRQFLTHSVPDGFAKGIKTNTVIGQLIDWMQLTGRTYSSDGDLAIVFDRAAMGYMLTKRRPALNHSWTGWAESPVLRKEAMKDALYHGRVPQIAYRFLRYPVIPEALKGGAIKFPAPMTYANDDPISAYVTTNMRLIDVFSVQGVPFVELYVRGN